jgi:hypothetical protein
VPKIICNCLFTESLLAKKTENVLFILNKKKQDFKRSSQSQVEVWFEHVTTVETSPANPFFFHLARAGDLPNAPINLSMETETGTLCPQVK